MPAEELRISVTTRRPPRQGTFHRPVQSILAIQESDHRRQQTRSPKTLPQLLIGGARCGHAAAQASIPHSQGQRERPPPPAKGMVCVAPGRKPSIDLVSGKINDVIRSELVPSSLIGLSTFIWAAVGLMTSRAPLLTDLLVSSVSQTGRRRASNCASGQFWCQSADHPDA